MQKTLLLAGIVCTGLFYAQWAAARDVQLRSRIDTDNPQATTGIQTDTSNLSTEERVQRLERILNNQGLVDMLLRLDNLQAEIQAMRGELELHSHQIEEIKQRQRDLYVDIDRRLLRLERSGVSDGAQIEPSTSTAPHSGTAATASVAPQVKPETTSHTASESSIADEQKAYQNAFDMLRDLRYEQAVKEFRKFLQDYPQGRYAHIAQYWIGEAKYAQRDFKQAIVDYQKLISDYPNSPKLAEAMLKIGYSQYELKQYTQAETTLRQLIKSYPGTTEAGQAQNLIKKIRLKRAG